MGDTAISWTHRPGTRGRTWNPIRGCSRTIAAGAKQSGCGDGTGGGCYAERTAGRFCGPGKPYEGLVRITAKGPRWTGEVRLIAEHLLDPLGWREPSTVFVNSMSDLFHEKLSDDAIDQVFAVMALANRHTYQVLTKRADRMRRYITTPGRHEAWSRHIAQFARRSGRHISGVEAGWWPRFAGHIWLGVSTENQEAADERIPELLATPAAVRFLSIEPLLGPIDLSRFIGVQDVRQDQARRGVRLPSRDQRRSGDRQTGTNLAGSVALREPLGPPGRVDTMQSTTSGEGYDGRIFERSRDGGVAKDDSARSSDGMASCTWNNSVRTNGQPQERNQARQPSIESRTGDGLRTTTSCDPCASPRESSEPERRTEPRGEADRGTGSGDPSDAIRGMVVDGNCDSVRDNVSACVRDRQIKGSSFWIIVGAESGPGARPADEAWFISLAEQCRSAGVPFFVKQIVVGGKLRKSIEEFPAGLQIMQFPESP